MNIYFAVVDVLLLLRLLLVLFFGFSLLNFLFVVGGSCKLMKTDILYIDIDIS